MTVSGTSVTLKLTEAGTAIVGEKTLKDCIAIEGGEIKKTPKVK